MAAQDFAQFALGNTSSLPDSARIVMQRADGVAEAVLLGDLRTYMQSLASAAVAQALNDSLSLHGADIASATTIVLETATGQVVDVTGTTTITTITLSEGHVRIVRFTGALTLTNGASLVLPGAANITTVAGDVAIFVGYASGVVRCVSYSPITVTGTGSTVKSKNPTLTGAAATGLGVVVLNQGDDDEPLIDFIGTSAADGTKNISSSASEFSASGYLRISINGADRWVPFTTTPV